MGPPTKRVNHEIANEELMVSSDDSPMERRKQKRPCNIQDVNGHMKRKLGSKVDFMMEMEKWPRGLKAYWRTCNNVASCLSDNEGKRLLGLFV